MRTNEPVVTSTGYEVKRCRNLVGKDIGGQIYVHKDYAHLVVPEIAREILSQMTRAVGFKFNCVMWDRKQNAIRADEAPDFDTATEPHVGRTLKFQLHKEGHSEGHSNSIWHHKWLWVQDDYRGFDVEVSKEWSRVWTSALKETAKSRAGDWQTQLAHVGLLEEWRRLNRA